MNDKFKWTAHFQEQDIKNYKLACVKENVLRFIAKATGEPYNCTVMISFVLNYNHDDPFVYQVEFKTTLGDHLTGLGLLYVLRNDFDAEIVSVRPEWKVKWYDPDTRLIPKSAIGFPFVSLLVKPGKYSGNLCQRFSNGCPSYLIGKDLFIGKDNNERKIADLKESTIQKGARVTILNGIYKNHEGEVLSRTVAKASVRLNDGREINPRIVQIKAI